MAAVIPDSSSADIVTPKTVVITDDADVTLRCTQYSKPLVPNDNGRVNIRTGTELKVKAIIDFKVNAQVMIRNSAFLRAPLTKAGNTTINLKGCNGPEMEVILCALHSRYDNWSSSPIGQSITESSLDLPAKGLWGVLAYARDLLIIEHHKFDSWFRLWYERNSNSTRAETLLFPCFAFHHAEGFAAASKYMVYHQVRPKETKFEEYKDIHLPYHVSRRSAPCFSIRVKHTNNTTEQLGAARGRLKSMLASKLWDRVVGLIRRAQCTCREKTVFAYLQALVFTGGYPVKQATVHKSISYVLSDLTKFEGLFESPGTRCRHCSGDWVGIVNQAIKDVEGNFDGLCLDCMDHTKSKFAYDQNDDYWKHLIHDNEWDKDCCTEHGQATWYFSLSMSTYTIYRDPLI